MGVVNDVIFKGVHFEMHVRVRGPRVADPLHPRLHTPARPIGMRIGPNEIHIMAQSEG